MEQSVLLLPCETFKEMSSTEIEFEMLQMFERSIKFHKALRGEIPFDDYLDTIEFQGYDMDYLVEQCSESKFC